MHQAFRAVILLSATLLVSCGGADDTKERAKAQPPADSAATIKGHSSLAARVPAIWRDSAIHIDSVNPWFAALVIRMDGGVPRVVRVVGGGEDRSMNGPAAEQRVPLGVNNARYVVTPYRDLGTATFSAPDPGFPEDVSGRERIFQFTDPANGGVCRITILLRDTQ